MRNVLFSKRRFDSKTIVFDWDKVLVHGHLLNPQAISVLKRANRRFGQVGVWTNGFLEGKISAAKSHGVASYLDFFIGTYIEKEEQKIYWTKQTISSSTYYEQEHIVQQDDDTPSSLVKHPSFLGAPQNIILIEDVLTKRLARPYSPLPEERVVFMLPFGALGFPTENPYKKRIVFDLKEAYHVASRYFDDPSVYFSRKLNN